MTFRRRTAAVCLGAAAALVGTLLLGAGSTAVAQTAPPPTPAPAASSTPPAPADASTPAAPAASSTPPAQDNTPPSPPPPNTGPPPPPPPGPEAMPPGMMPPSMPGPPSADQLKPGPTVTLPATLKVSGVAAIVNGEKITNQELVTRFLESGGAPTLQELITETEIGQAAHKAHVAVTETEVTNLLSQTKVQLLERSPGQTWTEFLESHGLTEDYARDQMRMQLTVEKLAVAKLPPYTLSGKIHVYHILLATTSLPYATSSHTDADALAQIKTIKSEIDAGKMTFQNAAKEYSEDHSNSSKGGDLGWISESDPLDPAFKQAAFALKQGQVSDPVKSQFGWHLIYLAKMGENATAAEVQQAADDSLQQRSQPYIGAVVQQIQANAAVEGVLMPTPPKPKPPMPVMMPRSMPVQPMHSPSGKPSRSTPPPPPM